MSESRFRVVEKKPAIHRQETAFIVIDMQRDFVVTGGDFVPKGSYYEKRIKEIIRPIKELLQFASKTDIPIIYTRTLYLPGYVDAPRISMAREMGALKRGSPGVEIIDELAPKGNRVYTVEACRYDKFYGTNLEMLLHGLGIKTVVFMGTVTNVCVESTARAARERDFFPIVLSDCTATFEKEWQQVSLTIIDSFFGSVLTSRELLSRLN